MTSLIKHLKPHCLRFLFLLDQFGFNPLRTVHAIKGLYFYFAGLIYFLRFSQISAIRIKPCLHDRFAESGITKDEYFWQDLIVAQWIADSNPSSHVDIGSRIDGFVAHLASFRSIEVLDIRPLPSIIPGISFLQIDLSSTQQIEKLSGDNGYTESLSCLHVLEHIGLGRYGDTLSLNGYRSALSNLSKLLKSGGSLYLSVPVGHPRIEFNANRVLDLSTLFYETTLLSLTLQHICFYDTDHGLSPILHTPMEALSYLHPMPSYTLALMKYNKS